MHTEKNETGKAPGHDHLIKGFNEVGTILKAVEGDKSLNPKDRASVFIKLTCGVLVRAAQLIAKARDENAPDGAFRFDDLSCAMEEVSKASGKAMAEMMLQSLATKH